MPDVRRESNEHRTRSLQVCGCFPQQGRRLITSLSLLVNGGQTVATVEQLIHNTPLYYFCFDFRNLLAPISLRVDPNRLA